MLDLYCDMYRRGLQIRTCQIQRGEKTHQKCPERYYNIMCELYYYYYYSWVLFQEKKAAKKEIANVTKKVNYSFS